LITVRDPDKDDITEKNPIPLKWVLISIVVFAVFYHLALILKITGQG